MMEKRKRKGPDEGVGILDAIFKVSRGQPVPYAYLSAKIPRMTSRDVSKEKPGTTERLDHVRDFVDGKDIMTLLLLTRHIRNTQVSLSYVH